MDIPAELLRRLDELARTDFQDIRDWYFNCLLVSAGLVFIGILMEGPEVVQEVREALRRFRPHKLRLNAVTGIPVTERHSGSWIRVVSVIGWSLVLFGVVGEGIFEGYVSGADKLLEVFDTTLLTYTQNETAFAIARATEAQASLAGALASAESAKATARGFEAQIAESGARVKSAEAQVASANAASKQAVATVATAEARIAEARAGAAKAQDSAAKAEVRVRELDLELTKLRTPRTLTGAQELRIGGKLTQFSSTPFELAVDPIPEAISLVGMIDFTLRLSAWEYKDSENKALRFTFTLPTGSKVEQKYLTGLSIGYSDAMRDKYRPAAEALRDALKAEGLDARIDLLRNDDPSPNHVRVTVGVKE